MSQIPDFTKIALDSSVSANRTAATEPLWETPEGIAVKPVYTASDRNELDFLDTYPGLPPFIRGPYPTMYVHRTRFRPERLSAESRQLADASGRLARRVRPTARRRTTIATSSRILHWPTGGRGGAS